MRRFILGLSLLGVLLFGGACLLSILSPITVERAAREIVRIEVEWRVGERIDRLSDARIAGLARRALDHTDAELAASARRLRDEVPRRVAERMADLLKVDCDCRARMVSAAREIEQSHWRSLSEARARLDGLIESTYGNVAAKLLREVRIFTAANAAAFAVLGLVTLLRRRAGPHLLPTAVVLVGAVLTTGGCYLFKQDWLHTIVFNDYLGWAYAGWLAGVALLLADVVFNRARITTRVLNAVGQIVGDVPILVPC